MNLLVKIKAQKLKVTEINLFAGIYFTIGILEVLAEYHQSQLAIYVLKPLILPTLLIMYLRHSAEHDYLYISALIFSWVANIFFISSGFWAIFTGSMFFFVFRVLSLIIVIRHTKLPSAFPTVVGSMPFVFVFMYLIYLVYENLGEGLPIYIGQCVLMSFLGGVSVGNFILRSNKANTYLLLSTAFFAITQLIFGIRVFYDSSVLFQPAAMALFVAAQYMFFKFLMLAEKNQAGFKL